MVRFMVLYDQPEDAEAFDRHYRVVHIPLAKKLPGLRAKPSAATLVRCGAATLLPCRRARLG